MKHYKIVAFDADDTLWVNEPIFTTAQEKFKDLISKYILNQDLEKKLYETEIKNLKIFGYGAKGFTLSMIETAIELTNGEIKGAEIQKIIDYGKEILSHPVNVLDGVKEVLKQLQGKYTLMILTKGDLFDQESKIARSELDKYFDHFEIVSEKNEETYQGILERYGVNSEQFLMIGNSLRSDILPLVHIGCQAIHIPFHTTWQHEVVKDHELENKEYVTLGDVRELPNFLGL